MLEMDSDEAFSLILPSFDSKIFYHFVQANVNGCLPLFWVFAAERSHDVAALYGLLYCFEVGPGQLRAFLLHVMLQELPNLMRVQGRKSGGVVRRRCQVLSVEERQLVSNQLEVFRDRDSVIAFRFPLDVEGQETVDAVYGRDVGHGRHGMLLSMRLDDRPQIPDEDLWVDLLPHACI